MCRRTQLCSKLWEAEPDHVKLEGSSKKNPSNLHKLSLAGSCSFYCVLIKQLFPSQKQGKKLLRGEKGGRSTTLGNHNHSAPMNTRNTFSSCLSSFHTSHVWMQLPHIIHVHVPISHALKHSRSFATLVPLPRGQFFQCLVCVGSLHGLTTAWKEALPSQEVSIPHCPLLGALLFPQCSQPDAFCLCEVPAFGLFLHSPARGAKDTAPLGAPGCQIYSLGSVWDFFLIWQPGPLTPQVLSVIGAPKARPAEMHFLIPSMERLWWGSILRRNFQCFSKFLKKQLPHPTWDCRLSRH